MKMMLLFSSSIPPFILMFCFFFLRVSSVVYVCVCVYACACFMSTAELLSVVRLFHARGHEKWKVVLAFFCVYILGSPPATSPSSPHATPGYVTLQAWGRRGGESGRRVESEIATSIDRFTAGRSSLYSVSILTWNCKIFFF